MILLCNVSPAGSPKKQFANHNRSKNIAFFNIGISIYFGVYKKKMNCKKSVFIYRVPLAAVTQSKQNYRWYIAYTAIQCTVMERPLLNYIFLPPSIYLCYRGIEFFVLYGIKKMTNIISLVRFWLYFFSATDTFLIGRVKLREYRR